MLRELLFFLSLSLSSWPGGRMKSVLLPSLGVSTISQIVSIININGKIKFVVSHARSPDFYQSDFFCLGQRVPFRIGPSLRLMPPIPL